ncbi:alpha/beta hydrolase [Streptomyces sp. NPDC056682]|uniref:alpha/beta hydrolase n=1 Tax=Streptomyces sp. NPDC056682 TaxID=3345909 RepID=UPI003694EA26
MTMGDALRAPAASSTAFPAAEPRETYGPVAGGHGARLLRIGAEDARRVLVVVPPRGYGANVFLPVARDLVRALPDLQVWAVDRRQQQLADLGGFAGDLATARTYYLQGRHRKAAADTAGAAGWGLAELLDDVRLAVREAGAGGRQVILGGHSLGGLTALAYAAWDFDGRRGAEDLAGLMVLDGGPYHAYRGAGIPTGITLDQARAALAGIEGGAVFEEGMSAALGLGDEPEAGAIWWQLAARHALADPHGPAELAHALPDAFAIGRPLTNAGLFGLIADTLAPQLGHAIQSGRLTDTGDWLDLGPSPLARIAQAYAGDSERSAREWYSPSRAMLDYHGVIGFADSEVARLLGLRLWHTHALDVPVYVFESNFARGTVGEAARELAKNTRIPSLALHSDFSMLHQDILFAVPERNSFLKTAVPFVESVTARS